MSRNRKTTVRSGVVTALSNAKDNIDAQAAGRVTVSSENARDPLNEHAAKQGLGNLPGIRKDAKGKVLTQDAQVAPKEVSNADLVLSKADMTLAESVAQRFKVDAEKYTGLKEKLETAKGGLSTIMLEMAKRASERMAEHPQWRWAFFQRLCSYAEGKAIADYKKATDWHKKEGAKEPTVREAINPAWQTYKSQIGRSIQAGYDPQQFANGTAFRQAAAKPVNRGTRARTDSVDSPETVIDDPMISGALVELTKRCTAVAEGKRDEVADIIMEAAKRVQDVLKKSRTKAKTKTVNDEAGAVASM